MALSKEKKQELITKYGESSKDTGKTEVQIAILTAEISLLTEHLKNAKKDLHSKSGIYSKSAKRNRLLKFLKNEDIKRYNDLIKKLKLRDVN